jgi:hypothetical protein
MQSSCKPNSYLKPNIFDAPIFHLKVLAVHNLIYPAIIALKAKRPTTLDFDGHMALSVPMRMPTEPKFENPHSAYVEITIDFSFK